MKHKYLIPVALILLLAAACSHDSVNTLPDLSGEWKFNPGDDPSWSAPAFDDAGWPVIRPQKPWERQGYEKLDGYAWYRIRVVIPSALKEGSYLKDSLQFCLGKIDDCDQVFLNGSMIGENTVTLAGDRKPEEDFTKRQGIWDTPRRYVLATGDPRILWDKENVIAIRVFDQDGLGGLFSDHFAIRMADLPDYLTYDFSETGWEYQGNTLVVKRFSLENLSGREDFSGVLSIRLLSSQNGNVIFSRDTLAVIPKGEKKEFVIASGHDRSLPVTAQISFTEGASGIAVTETLEWPYILTPQPPKEPRINGARVFGVRPGSPFLYKVAATGEGPLCYYAYELPADLSINENTGIITGKLLQAGSWTVRLCVENHWGHAERELRIECGDLISLTPPLGWNSWNCWGLSVSDGKVRQSADAMKSSGLIDHGWTYVNIDDGWEYDHVDSVIRPNSKFPDMKGLCDYIHSLGLKAGIYSSPGPLTCGGYEGSYGYEFNDAWSYASWGIDYLKYDWCSYFRIAPEPTAEQLRHPYKLMKRAIRSVPRDIHYSLCQYGMGEVWTWGAGVDGNSWRTTGDITDMWESMSGIGFSQGKCSPYAGPGRWNDPDMLVVGWVGWGPALHYTQLTPDEQYTHITLWSMLASPLLIGCDLSRLDPFTLNLLTNDEVLAVNQDPLGKQAVQVQQNETSQVWMKEMEDGSVVVGLFNLTERPVQVQINMSALGLSEIRHMRDLWKQECLGRIDRHAEFRVPPHGARMIQLRK